MKNERTCLDVSKHNARELIVKTAKNGPKLKVKLAPCGGSKIRRALRDSVEAY